MKLSDKQSAVLKRAGRALAAGLIGIAVVEVPSVLTSLEIPDLYAAGIMSLLLAADKTMRWKSAGPPPPK